MNKIRLLTENPSESLRYTTNQILKYAVGTAVQPSIEEYGASMEQPCEPLALRCAYVQSHFSLAL
jgi:hypothetical protein